LPEPVAKVANSAPVDRVKEQESAATRRKAKTRNKIFL